ncbi:hypothetical protein BN1184_AY_00400 [Pantoea ananatis]|nr:hypothetical protein BN1184_AY_00400 [Pantoea ananatis]
MKQEDLAEYVKRSRPEKNEITLRKQGKTGAPAVIAEDNSRVQGG